jgi:hypothetical protein
MRVEDCLWISLKPLEIENETPGEGNRKAPIVAAERATRLAAIRRGTTAKQ